MKIGIVLGSGSARGWAHIGVLRALDEAGIKPEIVCGSSIGALVGAVYADDGLEALEDWVAGLTWRTVLNFFDISFNGGFIKGAKLTRFLEENFLEKKSMNCLVTMPPWPPISRAGARSGCAKAGWPKQCALRLRCRVCSRRSSATGGCWSMADSSIRSRFRCAGRWERIS